MITALGIRNFKCFPELKLSFAQLTLLTGFNGGGKSTSIQPLLLIAQALRGPLGAPGLALNGPLAQLGTVGDVLPANSKVGSVKIEIRGRGESIGWTFMALPGERFLEVHSGHRNKFDWLWRRTVWPARRPDPEGDILARQLKELIYLSAIRIGPAESFPVPNSSGSIPGDVGFHGEYAPYWYDQAADDEVAAAALHPAEDAKSYRKQLEAYLGSLFPSAQANVSALPQASLMTLQFRLSETSAWQRPMNTGYGLTYAFPILVALLSAHRGQIIVIDSPEAHLHPSAQSQMGRILARFAAAGRQIIVETHSDHILNGVRLAVMEGTLPRKKLAVHFFGGKSGEVPEVTSLRLDARGKFNVWPKGFFDQSEEDLSRLAGWA